MKVKIGSSPITPFKKVIVDNKKGTLKLCYFTEILPSHLLAAFLWIDRSTHPGKELFNARNRGMSPHESFT